MKKLEAIRHLISCWERRDIDALLDCLTEDVEYFWHVGSPPVRGKDTMRKFLQNYSGAYEQLRWEIFNHAERDNLLLVEGHEELLDRKHDRKIQQPFMQAFEFEGNKIARWRDYYEPENLKPPAAEEAQA